MAGTINDVNIAVNPLTKNPDKCYAKEKRRGRYRKLVPVNVDDLKKAGGHTVRFVCISDTHSFTKQLETTLPAGDVLIHAGDFTQVSKEGEIIAFNEFLGKVKDKFKHIVVIAGNHELSFDPAMKQKLSADRSKQLLTNCTYLEEESVELYGIKIFGSPWQPAFCNWGFNGERGEFLLEKWQKIPTDTDIVVTHGPPLGIGDLVVRGTRAGCAELLATLMDRVRPKYHLFGHIHEDYGVWSNRQTTFINASTCNLAYQPVNKPIVFDYELPEEFEIPGTVRETPKPR